MDFGYDVSAMYLSPWVMSLVCGLPVCRIAITCFIFKPSSVEEILFRGKRILETHRENTLNNIALIYFVAGEMGGPCQSPGSHAWNLAQVCKRSADSPPSTPPGEEKITDWGMFCANN